MKCFPFATLPLVVMLGLGVPAIAEEPANGDPLDLGGLVLVAHGGPVVTEIEVELNGEWAMTIVDEPPLFTEIADLLKPGLNELRVLLRQPDAPRTAGRQALSIAVQATEQTSRGQSSVGRPLAEVDIPTDAAAGCEETVRFWVGRTTPPADLKKQYWLFVTGPPVGVRIATIVNGTVVHDTTSGNQFIDITPFVVKGKNTAEFESRPTCLKEETGQEGYLTLAISAAELDVDTVRSTEPAQVLIEIARKKEPQPGTLRRTFRAR